MQKLSSFLIKQYLLLLVFVKYDVLFFSDFKDKNSTLGLPGLELAWVWNRSSLKVMTAMTVTLKIFFNLICFSENLRIYLFHWIKYGKNYKTMPYFQVTVTLYNMFFLLSRNIYPLDLDAGTDPYSASRIRIHITTVYFTDIFAG